MEILDTPVKCLNEFDPIAVVDDSASDLTITKRVYERSDLKNPLITFTSGQAFMDYMMQVREKKAARPVLVLMDINMPRMNGFQTITEMRTYEDFMEIPVIVMLTNSDSIEDKEKSMEVGANGFQTKDFNIARYTEFFNSLKP